MHIRVSKYNPKNRDADGRYMIEDWISVSDVGNVYSGVLFTKEEYEKVEQKYLKAIELLCQRASVDSLTLTSLENYRHFSFKDLELIDGKAYPLDQALRIAQAILREEFWGLLTADKDGQDYLRIFIGYDYLMGLEYPDDLKGVISGIEKIGLYVER